MQRCSTRWADAAPCAALLGAAKIQTAANHNRLKSFLRLAAIRIALYEEHLCAL
jgi:hypothetical protein